MIHDAQLPVTCDGYLCAEEIQVDCPFSYTRRTSDSKAEREIESAGWIVQDGLHSCSPECQVKAGKETK